MCLCFSCLCFFLCCVCAGCDCPVHTCYNASGVDYYGAVSVAVSGNVCLRWSAVSTANTQLQMTGTCISTSDTGLQELISETPIPDLTSPEINQKFVPLSPEPRPPSSWCIDLFRQSNTLRCLTSFIFPADDIAFCLHIRYTYCLSTSVSLCARSYGCSFLFDSDKILRSGSGPEK